MAITERSGRRLEAPALDVLSRSFEPLGLCDHRPDMSTHDTEAVLPGAAQGGT